MFQALCGKCINTPSGISEDEFYDYWLNKHGPLVASHAASLNIKRYVQSHAIDNDFGHAISSGRGMEVRDYDGIAELCWASRGDLDLALQTAEGKSAGALLAKDKAAGPTVETPADWRAHKRIAGKLIRRFRDNYQAIAPLKPLEAPPGSPI
ncbi:MAG: EthD domain-containing protein [Halioglobus sp.]